MALTAGTRLGHYDVTALIGEGGMGQVWQATDTQLNRQVALKILPDAFATDPDRLARFTREAQVLASLNHPNIAAIYGIEEAEGTRALVLELVEGPTLADRISKGSIPLDEALPIAKQIAEALEAAHEAGVIHRDLKPANIKVREDGTVKVLDFGLAKALAPDPVGSDAADSPTMTAVGTRAGLILGTPAYTSPEQARGGDVDRRADIWSFGVVLYEMVTGRPAFTGPTLTDTLAAVVRAEPDWSVLPDDTPTLLRRLLGRCLRKDRKTRLQHIGDARLEISEALETPVDAGLQGRDPKGRRVGAVRGGLVAAAILASFVVGGVVTRFMREPGLTSVATARSSFGLPAEAPLAVGNSPIGIPVSLVAIAPDGTTLVYVARVGDTTQLYLGTLGTFGATPLPGTEGAYGPFFSPDGQSVGFLTPGEIKRVSLLGGQPETITETMVAWSATWGADGIYFADDAGETLKRVPPDGGPQTVISRAEEDTGTEGYFFPAVLPDGKGIVMSTRAFAPLSADYRDIRVWSPETGMWKTVLRNAGYHVRYVSTGHLVYARSGGLRAVPFDLDRLEVTGEPVPVLDGLAVQSLWDIARFAVSREGTLIYVGGGDLAVSTLAWVDRQGRDELLDLPTQAYGAFALSPDGTQLAIQVSGATDDLWIYDVATGTGRRLTAQGNNGWPLWMPDGERIVFSSTRGGRWGIYAQRVDGSTDVAELYTDSDAIFLFSWSWAHDLLMFGSGSSMHLRTLSGVAGLTPALVPAPETDAFIWGHRLSPNGRWIAYSSNQDGPFGIYVSRYPEFDQERKLSTCVGVAAEPIWSPAGDELFYWCNTTWMSTTVSTEGVFSNAPGRELFETRFVDTWGLSYDIGPDGRFLIPRPAEDDPDTRQLRVIQNWHKELLERVPVP